uniref:Protein FLUORESCENT IN BLUE LIGHTic isoform X3 n=1 Tax=Rhizophora mucronata TaxID=61149 RepID=A0A2P2MF58_RHIMU
MKTKNPQQSPLMIYCLLEELVAFQPCNMLIIEFPSSFKVSKFSGAICYCSISLHVSRVFSLSLRDGKNHRMIFNGFTLFTIFAVRLLNKEHFNCKNLEYKLA